MKKAILFFLMTFSFIGLFAQNKGIYGYFAKSDGSKINGPSTRRFFEKQLLISSYTGGSDNTATIEILVPTSGYVGEFRNIMFAATTTTPSMEKTITKSQNFDFLGITC